METTDCRAAVFNPTPPYTARIVVPNMYESVHQGPAVTRRTILITLPFVVRLISFLSILMRAIHATATIESGTSSNTLQSGIEFNTATRTHCRS